MKMSGSCTKCPDNAYGGDILHEWLLIPPLFHNGLETHIVGFWYR